MDDASSSRTSDGGSGGEPRGVRPKTWIIAPDGADGGCDHPIEDLRYVGDDGVNVYYECPRCGAVLVSGDALARAVRASRRESE